jgi:hypothetical protein
MSNSNEITKESFLNDVKDHVMTVNVNLPNGYRHIVFSKPDTVVERFEIVTTPSRLFYTGDMGSFTFGREYTDMVYFFGTANDINVGYWTEKCIASDGVSDGIYTFDADTCIYDMVEYMEENEFSEDAIEFFNENLYGRETIKELRGLCDELNFNQDFDDQIDSECYPSNTGVTGRFLWCLHAINWGCRKFIESQSVMGDV